MIKKLLIAVGVVVAVVVLLLVVTGVIVYTKVDKAFIASRMSQALNRQVFIEKIDASVFSVLSGIEIRNVAISNFKTPKELSSLQGKPVETADVFASMESFRFKIKILPLLKRQVELSELVMYSPVVNLTRNKQGQTNIDDLIKSRKPSDPKETKDQGSASPLSVDALPVAIAVGEIGMKNGTINYHDGEYNQKIQIYKLTTLLHDIRIDPRALEQNDEIKLTISMGARTVGAMKTGSVETFDITIDTTGKVIPFDLKTRLLDPEIVAHVAVPDGEITGLQIFSAVASVPLLGDYLGPYVAFLKDKQQWKGSKQTGLDLRYKAANAEIKNGRLELKDAAISFDGTMNLDSKAVGMNLGIVMRKEINESVQALLAKQIEAAIKSPEVKKYADSGKLAGLAMKPLLNRDDRIELKAAVSGTTKNPAVKLTHPQLNSIGKFVQDNAGSLAMEAGKGVAKQLLKEDQQKLLDDVGNLLKNK